MQMHFGEPSHASVAGTTSLGEPVSSSDVFDSMKLPAPPKGSGPRLFCGHVPKEVTEDLVKAHFSRWGLVTDVYFPRHKKTLKRRPFCFITFATKDSAERALDESPLNICGIPIKNITMVEDRDKYYKDKHAAARQALLSALAALGTANSVPNEQVNNIAALLAMDGISPEAVLTALIQQYGVGSSVNAAPSVQTHGQAMQQQPNPVGQAASLLPQPCLQGHQSQLMQSYGPPRQQPAQGIQGMSSLPRAMPHSQGVPLHPSSLGAVPQLGSQLGPYSSMLSREGSINSLSSNSDFVSVGTTSARTSMEMMGPQYYTTHPFGNMVNISSEQLMCLKQQLQAIGTGNGSAPNSVAVSSVLPSVPSQEVQQQWQQHSELPLSDPTHAHFSVSPAAILSSSLYSTSSVPSSGSCSASASAGFGLSPIKEGKSDGHQRRGSVSVLPLSSQPLDRSSLCSSTCYSEPSLPVTTSSNSEKHDLAPTGSRDKEQTGVPSEVSLLEALTIARECNTP